MKLLKRLINKVRAFVWGRCPNPRCQSFNVKQVEGWQKLQCRDCGHTWRY